MWEIVGEYYRMIHNLVRFLVAYVMYSVLPEVFIATRRVEYNVERASSSVV